MEFLKPSLILPNITTLFINFMISHTVLKPSQGHESDVGIGTVEFHCSDYADNIAIHSGIKPYFPKAKIPEELCTFLLCHLKEQKKNSKFCSLL